MWQQARRGTGPFILGVRVTLGRVLAAQGRFTDSESVLRDTFSALRAGATTSDTTARRAHAVIAARALGDLCEQRGAPEEAREWRTVAVDLERRHPSTTQLGLEAPSP